MTDPDSYNESSQAICEIYLDQLPATMRQIETLWNQIRQEGWHSEVSHRIQQEAHKLAGSSLIFGFNQIGMACRVLENSLKDAADLIATMAEDHQSGSSASARRREVDLISLGDYNLDALRQAVDVCLREEPEDMPGVMHKSMQDTRARQLIYLVEDDPIQAGELTLQIGYFGYNVQPFTSLTELRVSLEQVKPALILMDIAFPEGDMAGAEAILALRQTQSEPIPVVFVSSRADLSARLQAVRAGGKAYFNKPVNIGKLIDVIDHLLKEVKSVPYRVLVVDDVSFDAKMTVHYLEEAGMETAIVNDPLKIIETLLEFNPELILLDIYMPGCSGLELAEVIRQMDSFLSIPIVYLSAETDRDKQLQAMGLGADDFLTKPIRGDYLVSAVTSRIERCRQLRSLMVRDSLTGTFNHTTIKELLNQELFRAGRQNAPLAYVMIDLDHFKQVNDTYGHAAGDRVLRSLAHLLIKRLRIHDIVGRYGGEEFSVVLPFTTGLIALKILDELRADFAKVLHQTSDAEFSVTFSCGIALYPQYSTLGLLSEAADKALYAAKQQGRNRVVLAD